jgi:ferrochelatase
MHHIVAALPGRPGRGVPRKETSSTMTERTRVGVILLTYGSPETLDDVPQYMANVRGGRPAEPELVEEFKRRYALIGGSPLVRITREQAAALERELNRRHPDGPTFRATVGMRFAPPSIADAAREIGPESDELIGVIMSPQYSPILMSGYNTALDSAVAALGRDELRAAVAGDWHLQPDFVAALAQRVREALDRLPADVRQRVPVLLTAHSMPQRVVEKEPRYIESLHETANAVAALVGLDPDRWMFCYQSAGHTPEEWLKPDFADIMPILREQRYSHVLIAPVQFLADHLEILYDIEVGAREQAEAQGIQFARTESLNVMPKFIEALAGVVEETRQRAESPVA